jgi:hydrogenase maturation protein HypF
VVLGGGCFYNQLLSRLVTEQLSAAGLQVQRPQTLSCGDAGLALGQAWVAACKMANNANHNATT